MTGGRHRDMGSWHAPPSLIPAIAITLTSVFGAVITWPGGSPVPGPGLDLSWGAALHMAANDGLNFGRDVNFTYGPLGFLEVPKFWFGTTGSMAVLFQLAEQVLLIAVLIGSLRSAFGWLALPLAVVVAAFQVSPILVLVALLLSFALLQRPMSSRQATLVAGALGGLAIVEVLVKLNAGFIAFALGALAVCAHPARRRTAPAFVVVAATVGAAAWLVTGQSVTDIPAFISAAVDVTSGYSEAMGFEAAGSTWQYGAAAIVAALGVLAAYATRRGRPVQDVAVALLWLLFAFGSFKAGFVRHDSGHGRIFFLGCVVGLAGFAWRRQQRTTALATLGVPIAAVLALTPNGIFGPLDPAGHLSDAHDALAAVVSSENRAEIAAIGRSAIASGTQVPPDLVERARRAGPVAAWPYELSVLWLAGGDFRPLPLLQDYQAYTPALDHRDAEMLVDPARAPAAILMEASEGIVDGRRRSYNAPLTVRELTCRYRAASDPSNLWMLAVRRPDRCGQPPRKIVTVRAGWDEPVAIPTPDGSDSQVLMAVSGLQVAGLEKVRTAAFRAHDRWVVAGAEVQRIVPGLTKEPALVRAGADADFPGAQALAPGPSTLRFLREGAEASGRPLKITFYEQQLSA